MDKRYQVFISSTFTDLEDARQEVSTALLEASCFPAGMELFPAADEGQFRYIQEIIDQSDYYIIISAGRYGTIPDGSSVSYTEMEYDYALSQGKPIIRLLHKDPMSLSGHLLEATEHGRKKLENFRLKLSRQRLVKHWGTKDELGKQVVLGLLDAQKRHPQDGWVKSSVAAEAQEQKREMALIRRLMETQSSPGVTEKLFDDLPVPMLRLSLEGKVLASNREAEALLPMSMTDETMLSDLLEGLGRPVEDWLADVAAGRNSTVPQFLRGTRPHQDTVVQVILSKNEDQNGQSFIAVLNDATELKTLEMQFVQSQKMQAIGQLAGGVAHDFNNLLTAISGHCDLLMLRHDQGDKNYNDLVQIHQNANRAASLVGQLLAFSRKQNLMPEVLDLREILSDLTHLLARLLGEKVTVTLKNDPRLRNVRADRRQLEQVIMNLVVNARDAMPYGGNVHLETEHVVLSDHLERDRATVPPGPYCVLRVTDNGRGIASDQISKIFDPFWTTKRPGEGTGLGLSTAYGIVKQSGGHIFVDSKVGKGSTFTLYFAALDSPVSAKKETDVTPLPLDGNATGTILVVEDEAPVRAFASRALRMRGYSVLEADSAESALDMLSDPDLLIDVFVSNVIMPGLDGPTWVRQAMQQRPDVKVVFISGYAEDSFDRESELPMKSVFLPKPFSLHELTSTVAKALEPG